MSALLVSGELSVQVAPLGPEHDASGTALGRLLRAERERRGLSREELADRAGGRISPRTIGNIERGDTHPYRHTVEVLADALALAGSERAALLAARRAESAGASGRSPRNTAGRLDDLARGAPADQAAFPPAPSRAPPSNLPLAVTSFIGREQELAEVRCLLTTTRLLTLTGSGGCGKTRLALEAADLARASFAHGVWLVELAPLADPSLVPPTFATALGVREQPGQPLLRTLLAALSGRQLLLLLDNCEHLRDACAGLAEAILRACPNVRLLTTSREPLGIAGEVAWRVPSLGLPDPAGALDATAALASEAVQLFAARAALVRPEFTVDARNAAAVVAICRRLDGIPLALELAAARLRVLAPEQLLARLDDRFRLLVGGRSAPRRQQTLRAAIDWSHDLLGEPERRLFRRLAVFAGGWTLEAAEAVGATAALGLDALDGVESLLTKSLLLTTEDDRFTMLGTIQEYAREQLLAGDEAEETARRHAEHFLTMSDASWKALLGAAWNDSPLWFTPAPTDLAPDADDLWAAARWLLEHCRAEEGLRLAALAGWVGFRQGRIAATEAALTTLLALDGPACPTTSRALVLHAAGQLAHLEGDFPAMHVLAEELLAVARQLGSQPAMAQALSRLGVALRELGAYEEALAAMAECRTLLLALGDREQAAHMLIRQGEVYQARGELRQARAAYEQSLADLRGLGEEAFRENFRLHHHLGSVSLEEGDLAAARVCFDRHVRDIPPSWGVWRLSALADFAELAAAEGRAALALRLAGALAAASRASGTSLQPTERRLLDQWLARARQALTAEEAEAAWREGQGQTLDQALAEARTKAAV